MNEIDNIIYSNNLKEKKELFNTLLTSNNTKISEEKNTPKSFKNSDVEQGSLEKQVDSEIFFNNI